MLSVNLRHLESHELRLKGELAAAELDFDLHDEMIRAEQPLRYDLTVEKLDDALLVTGSLRAGAGLPVRPLPENFQAQAGFGGLDVPFAAGGRGKGGREQ